MAPSTVLLRSSPASRLPPHSPPGVLRRRRRVGLASSLALLAVFAGAAGASGASAGSRGEIAPLSALRAGRAASSSPSPASPVSAVPSPWPLAAPVSADAFVVAGDAAAAADDDGAAARLAAVHAGCDMALAALGGHVPSAGASNAGAGAGAGAEAELMLSVLGACRLLRTLAEEEPFSSSSSSSASSSSVAAAPGSNLGADLGAAGAPGADPGAAARGARRLLEDDDVDVDPVDIGAAAGPPDGPPPHRQGIEIDTPWWRDAKTSYVAFVVMVILGLTMIVFILEGCFLHSTLFGSRLQRRLDKAHHEYEAGVKHVISKRLLAIKMATNSVKPNGAATNGAATNGVATAVGKIDSSAAVAEWSNKDALDWHHDMCESFWRRVQTESDRETGRNSIALKDGQRGKDIVGFMRQTFLAMEESLIARIVLERTGACNTELKVRVVTSESGKSCFQAKAGKDFVPKDDVVCFAPGQTKAGFEVQLLPTNESWGCTRFFRVSLQEVVSGDALLGGPTIAEWRKMGTVPHVRVAIMQDDYFPCNMPMKRRLHDPSGLWLVFYYVKDRVKDRKQKFWKALAGVMYDPVHTVLVTVWVRKLLLDWACEPEAGGKHHYVLMLGTLWFVSMMFVRWGDQVQTKNRGRTGGVRQVHRRQLLQKLMMQEHSSAGRNKIHGTRWFYSALQNVEVMTYQGYWQVFELSKNCFALLLCLLSTIVDPMQGFTLTTESMTPTIGLLVITPLSLLLIMLRKETMHRLLTERMLKEEEWVDTYSWLCRSAAHLYSFGPRELAHIDNLFDSQSKLFVKTHWAARDMKNDSMWVTQWLGAAAYTAVLIWGAFRLLDAKRSGSDDFTTGDYVVLLSVYLKFARYLAAVNSCIVKMQTAAVSIRRVGGLLNDQGEDGSILKRVRSQELCVSNIEKEDRMAPYIEIRNVTVTGLGHGALGEIRKPISLSIPLGKIVTIKGSTEAARLTFMSLCAGLMTSTKGEVVCPNYAWSVMMPPVPNELPLHLTVVETIKLSGAPDAVANGFASVLGLEPDCECSVLPPGQIQLLALVRAILRDPEVLILVRPLAYVHSEQRPRIGSLLRAWQKGGTEQIVSWLMEEVGGKHTVNEACAPSHARTIILTGIDTLGGKHMTEIGDDRGTIEFDLDVCSGLAGKVFPTSNDMEMTNHPESLVSIKM